MSTPAPMTRQERDRWLAVAAERQAQAQADPAGPPDEDLLVSIFVTDQAASCWVAEGVDPAAALEAVLAMVQRELAQLQASRPPAARG